ncbi:MAG: extracellular solute-binding protein [Rhodobacteraceae bacterium]|nr:extracellular solute-binding protein [Paracoccaceae bacterium]
MTTRRRTLLAGTAALALSALVQGTPAWSQAKIELVIANSQWLDALRGAKLWAALEKYEQVNPNVDLVQEAVPSSDITTRLMTEMGAGLGPDIAIPQDALFVALAGAGFLLPLDDVAAGIPNLNATNDAGVLDGVRLGIAWQRSPYALIYNKKLLEQAGASVPTTVDELVAQAEKVSAATGAIGFAARHSTVETGWFLDFSNWAYGNGVNWVDAEGKLNVNTPEVAAAIADFAKMYHSGMIPIGDQMSTQRQRFKEGQVAFAIDASGGTLNIASGGAMPSTDLAAAPLPFPRPGAHQQIFVVLSKFSKHPEEARDFLRWLYSAEGQQSLREASGPDPLATDVPVSAEFIAANPWAPAFVEIGKTSRAILIPGHEVDTAAILRPVMEGVEKVLLGGATAEAAMAAAQAEIDSKFGRK